MHVGTREHNKYTRHVRCQSLGELFRLTGQTRNMVCGGHTDFSTEQGGTEYSGRWELIKQNDQIEIMAQIIWGKGKVPFTWCICKIKVH